jgi:hypothetical protein
MVHWFKMGGTVVERRPGNFQRPSNNEKLLEVTHRAHLNVSFFNSKCFIDWKMRYVSAVIVGILS